MQAQLGWWHDPWHADSACNLGCDSGEHTHRVLYCSKVYDHNRAVCCQMKKISSHNSQDTRLPKEKTNTNTNMMNLATSFAFVALFLSSFLAHGWVSPTTALNSRCRLLGNNNNDQALFFRPPSLSEEEQSSQTTYKVTKLQHSTAVGEDKIGSSKRRSFVANVQDKAVGLLLFSYEVDRKQFGMS